jgi:hypothetical protein
VTHVTPRWVLGTARLAAATRLQTLSGRIRRHPGSARVVPQPRRLGREDRPLQLTHVLVSSDQNPRYLDVWPLARRAWPEVAGLEPILVLVADEADVPDELRADPLVHRFQPVQGVHTALQAQCIRLLYPALLDGAGGVLLADIDMVPMNRRYFHRPAAHVHETDLVAYRDVMLPEFEVPICYNAALPRTWQELFGIGNREDIAARLVAWATDNTYDGVHGGSGWATDQQTLYLALLDFGTRTRRAWILSDHYTGFRRLERATLVKPRRLTVAEEKRILRGGYSDFHCVLPYEDFRELNEHAVDLAVQGARRRGSPASR